jgi:hypothetical protein
VGYAVPVRPWIVVASLGIVWTHGACRGRFDALWDGGPGDGVGVDVRGDPSAVKLRTKHIYGRPGEPFSIDVIGGQTSSLQLRFIDDAHQIVHASAVTNAGGVTLPSRAGRYRVELRDLMTGGISHGQATITAPVDMFSPAQLITLAPHGPYAPHWPLISLIAADVDLDGYSDLVRGASVTDQGMVDTSSISVRRWDVGSAALGDDATVTLEQSRLCGFVMFDHDGDGDPDVITVAERTDSFDLEICVLASAGGSLSNPSCVRHPGSMQQWHHCHAGVVAADFDRDGRVDLAVAGGRATDRPATYTGTELLVFANRPEGFVLAKAWNGSGTLTFGGLAVGDVDDDGRVDILAQGGSPAELHVFLAGDDFAFVEPARHSPLHGDYVYDSITPGYLDGDTTLDVILVHPDGPSTVFRSNGTTFEPALIPSFSEQHGSRAIVLDPGIDGEVDILLPYKNRYLQTNRMGGMLKADSTLTSATAPSLSNSILGAVVTNNWAYVNFVFDDFDGDGLWDALFMSGFTFQIELLRGN